jgi:hypothetical protein
MIIFPFFHKEILKLKSFIFIFFSRFFFCSYIFKFEIIKVILKLFYSIISLFLSFIEYESVYKIMLKKLKIKIYFSWKLKNWIQIYLC